MKEEETLETLQSIHQPFLRIELLTRHDFESTSIDSSLPSKPTVLASTTSTGYVIILADKHPPLQIVVVQLRRTSLTLPAQLQNLLLLQPHEVSDPPHLWIHPTIEISGQISTKPFVKSYRKNTAPLATPPLRVLAGIPPNHPQLPLPHPPEWLAGRILNSRSSSGMPIRR